MSRLVQFRGFSYAVLDACGAVVGLIALPSAVSQRLDDRIGLGPLDDGSRLPRAQAATVSFHQSCRRR